MKYSRSLLVSDASHLRQFKPLDIEMSPLLREPSMHIEYPSLKTCRQSGLVTVHTGSSGAVIVAVRGDVKKPAIITYHDLGMNSSSFDTLFNHSDMQIIVENFCIYHINAPGQEDGARTFDSNFTYPSMDELAYQLHYVLAFFGIKSFIGLGVGLGANVLARFAINNPALVDALTLINCSSSASSWAEWLSFKMNFAAKADEGLTAYAINYLVTHNFGRQLEERNLDLSHYYTARFARNNSVNLSMLMRSYINRTDLDIARDGRTIQVPVLNMTSALSPHMESTVSFNARLDPTKSTWMKISDCGNIIEEQPAKLAEAFRLLLQGEGYVAPLSPAKIMAFRALKKWERRRPCRVSTVIRITENPFSEALVC